MSCDAFHETAPDRDYLFSLLRYLYRWHIDAASN